MAISARLELRQSQGLVMTPQLQQAIKLLQLSNLDLTAFVEGELERNPLLEHDEDDLTRILVRGDEVDDAGVVDSALLGGLHGGSSEMAEMARTVAE